jgi:hypothetical protein
VTAKGRKEAVRADLAADLRHQWQFSLAKLPTATSTNSFETACDPLGPEGRSLTKNMLLGGFSAGLRRPNQLAVVAEFWFSADWPPYSPNLNSLNRQRFAAKRPGYGSR